MQFRPLPHRRDLLGAARDPGGGPPDSSVGEALDHQPAHGGVQLAQPREAIRSCAAVQSRGHDLVEHLGLVAQHRGEREHVLLRGRMDALEAPGTSSRRIRLRA